MQIPLDFSNRHAVVFGGTTGINFGIAQAFARAGARVSVVSRSQSNVDAALRVLEAIAPGKVHGACADVRDFEAVGAAFDGATQRFGPVDALVSGAAGNFLCEARDMSPGGFRAVVDIDLVGSFHVMRQGYAHLRKPGASVINITAPQAWLPMRYQVHCGAAKAGVDQLTRILALEWGPEGIRVNAISPGPIEGTEGVRRLLAPDEAQARHAASQVPLRRFGTLDDISNLALFLASPHASYISGAMVPCDGGGAFDSVRPALEAAGRQQAREAMKA
jgi:NAD(P)-dependent dehydrogenase (short-subunit alcohol dehydrogenase family)